MVGLDEVMLTSDPVGFPLFALKANDWRDGRNFKIASPHPGRAIGAPSPKSASTFFGPAM